MSYKRKQVLIGIPRPGSRMLFGVNTVTKKWHCRVKGDWDKALTQELLEGRGVPENALTQPVSSLIKKIKQSDYRIM